MIYDIWQFLCLSCKLTLCHSHWHMTISYCFLKVLFSDIFKAILLFFQEYKFPQKNIQMHFGKQNFDWLWIPLCKKININFLVPKICVKYTKNAMKCIFPCYPLAPLLIQFLLHFSFFIRGVNYTSCILLLSWYKMRKNGQQWPLSQHTTQQHI